MITILPGRRIRIPGEATNRRGLAFVALALLAFFAIRSDRFLTTNNMLNTGMAMSTIAILAIGSAALLVSGNVDLSIGSSYALVAVSVGQVVHHTESTALAVLFGLLLGALLGLINGALVWRLQLSPLIVTIGTLVGAVAGFFGQL